MPTTSSGGGTDAEGRAARIQEIRDRIAVPPGADPAWRFAATSALWLLSVVEELQRECDAYKHESQKGAEDYVKASRERFAAQDDVAALRARVAALEGALQKIAHGPYVYDYEYERFEECQGIARDVLSRAASPEGTEKPQQGEEQR